jgi:hypothetical protein
MKLIHIFFVSVTHRRDFKVWDESNVRHVSCAAARMTRDAERRGMEKNDMSGVTRMTGMVVVIKLLMIWVMVMAVKRKNDGYGVLISRSGWIE